ncbi:MAG TPA: A/G-specific adenine glycosylase [Castellaniella sp.]|uniref:A/G-specific adenine glycosylase n=1 Tax=Castellaniella sp. TaxID=1955812 RepID=UPI002EEDD9A2
MGPASRIAAWQRQSGRHGLPWQSTRDPYRIWLSEVMLQQTQAATVVPYYQRFLLEFPNVATLANAPLDAVLRAWAGLGYYARARNLHRCAQTIRDHHHGQFPVSAAALSELPGIGASTAAAIAAFSFGERAAILDGNVRRVLARYYALDGDPTSAAATRQLWTWAQAWLDQAPVDLDMGAYTQGQMDLGATVCTRSAPDCPHCPLFDTCEARRQGRQQELPHPRARRAQPERRCHILLAECGDTLLLQHRPPQGVWGGLWSLPQFDTDHELQDFCRHGGPPQALQPMAAFEHVFTHFRLHLQPWHLQTEQWMPSGEQGEHAWVGATQLAELGMPAPISRLLESFYVSRCG